MVKSHRTAIKNWIWYIPSFLALVAGILILLGIGYYMYTYTTSVAHAKNYIQQVTQQRCTEISFFFQNYIKFLQKIAKKSITVQSLADRTTAPHLTEMITNYDDTLPYKDILVIDTNGLIHYAFTNKKLQQTYVNHRSLKKSIIFDSFQRCRMSLTPDISTFTIDPYFKEPALVICTPILKDNSMIGVLMAQIDSLHLYKIIRNYQGLGNSGEIRVAQGTEQGTLLVAPMRYQARAEFRVKEIVEYKKPTLLYRATRGEHGSGLYHTRGASYIAAWRYIPETGWGILVSMDSSEILGHVAHLYEYIVWLVLSWLILMGIIALRLRSSLIEISHVQDLIRVLYRDSTLNIFLYLVWIICVAILGLFIYRYYTLPLKAVQETKKELAESMDNIQQQISDYLQKIAHVGNTLAHDIADKRLKKEDIFIRMKRDLEENPTLFGIIIAYEPYAYTKEKELFAPFMVHNQTEYNTYQLEQFYQYTTSAQPSGYQNKWYRSALKKGATWVDPFVEKITGQRLAFYSVPFYESETTTQKPLGVISIAYQLNDLHTMVSTLNIGQTGYAFILSQKGTFIDHPLESYITQGKTIFEIAQQNANDILHKIGQHAAVNRSFSGNYYDPKTSQIFHARIEPIVHSTWCLGALFVEQEVSISAKTLFRYQLWILLLIVIGLIVTIARMVNIHLKTVHVLKQFSFFMTILLIIAQISIWYLIAYSNPEETKKEIKIVDSIGLDKFFDNATYQAQAKHEPEPRAIPTGIFVNTIRLPEANRVFFQAYVWQKYVSSLPEMVHDIQLPGTTNIEKEVIYNRQEDDTRIIGWKISASRAQKTNFTFFPFDDIKIKIPLAPANMIQNILLLPDLTGYNYINPTLIPGTSTELHVPGFSTVQSFFAFEKIKNQTNFGLKEYMAVSDRFQLNYVLILSRNLINAFVVYLMPLLIILFSLFALFLFVNQNNVLSIVTSYTGLLFALVLLHQTLRNNYPAERILYIEYFFFFIYLSILLMVLHSLFLKMYGKYPFFEHFTVILRIFFWPLQLLAWFITTIIIFYE